MARELSPLQKAYADYFFSQLEEFGVETPASLDIEKKAEFFDGIKKGWKKHKKKLAEDGIVGVNETLTSKQKMAVVAEIMIRQCIRQSIVKEMKSFKSLHDAKNKK